MRETNFIEQNKDKWREFEHILDSPRKDPDKLNDLFVQITDDLSYSRTFYPNRSVRVYLNGLAQRIFFHIYKNRRSRARRLLTFWTEELPQLIHESRAEFRTSFLIFLLACLIGVVSSAMDGQFANVILGDSYVEMTVENIQSGDPMAVYKEKGAFGMSLGITLNNLFVAFLTFVMGVFFTVGTLALLIRNGIMLGAFQYFFIERGLFWDSFLTIWIHGTLEISAIIIAGAAGITMGRGLVFPGTYTRLQSFQRSARRGIKIMIGIAPVIIMAGFIEGYLTRHTDAPAILRGGFILACLAFVLFYFVWYPRRKARAGFKEPIRDTSISADADQWINFSQIKSSGEIFSEVFVFFRRHAGRIVLAALFTAGLYTAAVFLSGTAPPAEQFIFADRIFGTAIALRQFFVNETIPFLPVINILCFSIMGYVVFRRLILEEQEGLRDGIVAGLFKMLIPMGVLQLLLFTNFLTLALLPVPVIWAYASLREGTNPVTALVRGISLISQSYSKVYGLFLILMLVGFLVFALADSTLAWFYLDLASWVILLEESAMQQFSAVFLAFITIFILYLVFAIILIGGGVLYYSLLEIKEAPALMERIKRIGQRRSIKGLEQE
ncbi:MAG: stage II sporulation protein M [Phaeodactylibacter sp.]|nr:stage II sporulation protein M [Phaeodactylibacter sp.]